MKEELFIRNCSVFHAKNRDNSRINILVRGKSISKITSSTAETARDCIDAGGRTVTPGLIDVHIQGAGGADVLDSSEEAMRIISKTCARFGTTSFLATTVFRPEGENTHLEICADCVGKDLGGAHLLGTHIEGPFISFKKRGMIHDECICAPDIQTFKRVVSTTKKSLMMMTIAPELDGNISIIEALTSCGIVAAFGHSHASYEQTLKGIEAGITHVTHLFNAMPQLHHREPGPLLAIFENPQVSAQIISDGVHLHPRIIDFAYKNLGIRRCILITDAMQALGLPEGRYTYNGMEYVSKQGTARYHDGTLIGTTMGLNLLMLRFHQFTGSSFEDAVKAASENPARLLGIDNTKGSLEVGKDADLVIWDFDDSVWATIVNGKVVYKK